MRALEDYNIVVARLELWSSLCPVVATAQATPAETLDRRLVTVQASSCGGAVSTKAD